MQNDPTSVVANAMAQYQHHQSVAGDAVRQNRNVLMAALRELTLEKIEVVYSGSGDSGGPDDVVVTPESLAPAVASTQVAFLEPVSTRKDDAWTYELHQRSCSLREALQDFAMVWLSQQHGGWENNDGGEGRMTVDVQADTFTLEHVEFYTESSHHAYEL